MMRATSCLVGIVAAAALACQGTAPLQQSMPYNTTLQRHEEIENPELMPSRYRTRFVRTADGRDKVAVFDDDGNHEGFLEYKDSCLERMRTGGNWRFNQGIGDASGDLQPRCGYYPDETQRFSRAYPTKEHQIVELL